METAAEREEEVWQVWDWARVTTQLTWHCYDPGPLAFSERQAKTKAQPRLQTVPDSWPMSSKSIQPVKSTPPAWNDQLASTTGRQTDLRSGVVLKSDAGHHLSSPRHDGVDRVRGRTISRRIHKSVQASRASQREGKGRIWEMGPKAKGWGEKGSKIPLQISESHVCEKHFAQLPAHHLCTNITDGTIAECERGCRFNNWSKHTNSHGNGQTAFQPCPKSASHPEHVLDRSHSPGLSTH